MTRLRYLDNLRWAAILLLFPFHTAVVFCPAWYDYYVQSGSSFAAARGLTAVIEPWIMPLLFCIAGMSACYALRKRTPRGYLAERTRRLLVPFLAGVVLVCPVIAYYAQRFHTDAAVSFPDAVAHFFCSLARFPDLDRMAGDFSVAHLWFIIFLFVISGAMLGLVLLWRRLNGPCPSLETAGLPLIILLFVPLWVLNLAGFTVTGYSFLAYFLFFGAGMCLLSHEPVLSRLEAHRIVLLAAWLVLTAGVMVGWGLIQGHTEVFWGSSPLFVLTGWTGVLALLANARHLFDQATPATAYLTAASYPVYILHQAALVAVAYYLLPVTTIPPALQFAAIVIASLLLTFAGYEIVRRIPGVRALFGIAGPE